MATVPNSFAPPNASAAFQDAEPSFAGSFVPTFEFPTAPSQFQIA
jgi:hypothetical protein